MSGIKKFDVFLSYNSDDKLWVIALKNALQTHKIKVWLDKDEIRPGDIFAEALETGLKESKAVALIISPEAMASGWVKNEYYRALSLATSKQLQLIPVLYKKAEIPGFLKERNWVDFSNEAEYSQSVEDLVWGITGEKSLKHPKQKKKARNASKLPENYIMNRSGKVGAVQKILKEMEYVFFTNDTYYKDQCDSVLDQVVELRKAVNYYSSSLPPLYTSQVPVHHVTAQIDVLQNLVEKFRNTCPPGSIEIHREISTTIDAIKNKLMI